MSSTDIVKKNIIIAIPKPDFAEGFKKQVDRNPRYQVRDIVVVLDHLIDTIQNFEEEGTQIHGLILTTDIGEKLEDKRFEFLADVMLQVREEFSHVNIVILANEREGHPLLAELIGMGIYNLFLREKSSGLNVNSIIEALEKPLPFSKVSQLRIVDNSIEWRDNLHSQTKRRISAEEEKGQRKKVDAEKERVVEKIVEKVVVEKVVEKIIEVPVTKMVAVPSKIIAIASLYPGAGSTFITLNLAKVLGWHKVPVGVLEPVGVKPIWFETLFGFKNAPEKWSSWAKQIKEDKTIRKETVWQDESIVWVPLEPDFNDTDWTSSDSQMLLNTWSQIPIMLVDVSSHWEHEMIQNTFNMATEIWVVAGSSPAKVNTYKSKLQDIHRHQSKVRIVGNYWDKFIKQKDYGREWIESIGYVEGDKEYSFDFLAAVSRYGEEVTQAEWEGRSLFDNNKTRKQIEEELQPLVQRIVPKELLRQKKKSILKFSK